MILMILMIMNNILNMTYGIIVHKIKLLKIKMKIIVIVIVIIVIVIIIIILNKCEEIKVMI